MSKLKILRWEIANRYSYPVRRCPAIITPPVSHPRTGRMNESKAQLKKEEEEREKCEQELASMDNKIKLLEESLDKAEENLSQTTTKLNDIETVIITRSPQILSYI